VKYIDEEDMIAEYERQLQKKDKEIERLNNIINELENILKDLIFGSNNLNHKLTAQIILMRLKELKGSGKE
jgi:hypothetical protein